MVLVILIAVGAFFVIKGLTDKDDKKNEDREEVVETTASVVGGSGEGVMSSTVPATDEEIHAPAPAETTAPYVEEKTTVPPVTVPAVTAPPIEIPEIMVPEVTVPSAPAVDVPVATGVKTYTMGSEEEGEMIVVAFLYDENGNVTEFAYGMAADASISPNSAADLEDAITSVEAAFNQIKALGADVTVEYTQDGTEYYLEAEVIISNEIAAAFLSGMFGVENNGTIIKIADLEAAALAEGFTEYNEF